MTESINFSTTVEDRDVAVTATIVVKESALRDAVCDHGLGSLLSKEFGSRVGYMDVYEQFEAQL